MPADILPLQNRPSSEPACVAVYCVAACWKMLCCSMIDFSLLKICTSSTRQRISSRCKIAHRTSRHALEFCRVSLVNILESQLWCVAVCCSVLQCVTVCYSVLQCVSVCCSVLQCVAVCYSVLQCVAVCCSVLQCVAVWILPGIASEYSKTSALTHIYMYI